MGSSHNGWCIDTLSQSPFHNPWEGQDIVLPISCIGRSTKCGEFSNFDPGPNKRVKDKGGGAHACYRHISPMSNLGPHSTTQQLQATSDSWPICGSSAKIVPGGTHRSWWRWFFLATKLPTTRPIKVLGGLVFREFLGRCPENLSTEGCIMILCA